jgi:hypothetical protein
LLFDVDEKCWIFLQVYLQLIKHVVQQQTIRWHCLYIRRYSWLIVKVLAHNSLARILFVTFSTKFLHQQSSWLSRMNVLISRVFL